MSTLSNYYESNLKDNPYTMEGTKNSSRVHFLVEWVKKYAPIGGKILDVGCGDMYLSTLLPEYYWQGIDINTTANSGKCIKQDLEKFPYPFAKHAFDLVVCSEVLEHLYDPVRVTEEIRRVLKPTGTYLLSTPNFDWLEHFPSQFRPLLFDPYKSWTKEHIHCYNLQSHDQILAKSGFKRLEHKGADPHFGHLFNTLRIEINRYFINLGMDKDVSGIEADKLISLGFPEMSHTIMIAAR